MVSGLGSAFHTLLTGNRVNTHQSYSLEVVVPKELPLGVGRVGALSPPLTRHSRGCPWSGWAMASVLSHAGV